MLKQILLTIVAWWRDKLEKPKKANVYNISVKSGGPNVIVIGDKNSFTIINTRRSKDKK